MPEHKSNLVLVKVDPQALPLYFVVEMENHDNETYNSDENRSFYIDENTCPTNWLPRIVAVIANGDADPHGFATFVRQIPSPVEDFGDVDSEEILRLFPETATTT